MTYSNVALDRSDDYDPCLMVFRSDRWPMASVPLNVPVSRLSSWIGIVVVPVSKAYCSGYFLTDHKPTEIEALYFCLLTKVCCRVLRYTDFGEWLESVFLFSFSLSSCSVLLHVLVSLVVSLHYFELLRRFGVCFFIIWRLSKFALLTFKGDHYILLRLFTLIPKFSYFLWG